MCTIIYRFVIIVIPLIRTHVHVKAKSSNSPPFSNVRYRKYNVDIAAKIGESNRNSLHKQPSFLIEEIHVKKKKNVRCKIFLQRNTGYLGRRTTKKI